MANNVNSVFRKLELQIFEMRCDFNGLIMRQQEKYIQDTSTKKIRHATNVINTTRNLEFLKLSFFAKIYNKDRFSVFVFKLAKIKQHVKFVLLESKQEILKSKKSRQGFFLELQQNKETDLSTLSTQSAN